MEIKPRLRSQFSVSSAGLKSLIRREAPARGPMIKNASEVITTPLRFFIRITWFELMP